MTTEDARKCFKHYFALKEAIAANKEVVEIVGYRRKERFVVNNEIIKGDRSIC